MKMKKYVLRLVTGAAAAALLLSGCAAGEKSASEPSSASAGQTDAVTSATVRVKSCEPHMTEVKIGRASCRERV